MPFLAVSLFIYLSISVASVQKASMSCMSIFSIPLAEISVDMFLGDSLLTLTHDLL